MKQITPKKAKDRLSDDDFIVIDVRERFEIDAASIPKFKHIPMMEIPSRIHEIPKDKDVAVLCHTGSRSGRVAMYLTQQGFSNILNIQGGIDRWAQIDGSVPKYRKAFGRAQIIS